MVPGSNPVRYCPSAHYACERRGEYKAFLVALFLLASFFHFIKSSFFQKLTIKQDVPQNLRAFAKRMRFISLVVSILKHFEKIVDSKFSKK